MTNGQTTILPRGNRLLDSLESDERAWPATEVEEVHLKMKEQLCNAGDRIDSVYFPLSGVVSLLTRMQGTPGVERWRRSAMRALSVCRSPGMLRPQSAGVAPGAGSGDGASHGCRCIHRPARRRQRAGGRRPALHAGVFQSDLSAGALRNMATGAPNLGGSCELVRRVPTGTTLKWSVPI